MCRQTLREAGWAARASLPSPAWERVAAAAGPGGGTGRGGGLWRFLQGIVLMAEPGYGIIGPANMGRGASKLVAESGCLTVSPGLSEERVYIAGHGSLRYFSITVSRPGIFPNSVQRASTVAHPPHLEAQEHGEPRASHLVSSPDPGARSRPAFLCTSWGPHGCPHPAQPGSFSLFCSAFRKRSNRMSSFLPSLSSDSVRREEGQREEQPQGWLSP